MIKGVHFVRKRSANGITWYVYAYRGGPCVLKSRGPSKPKLGAEELSAIAEAIRQQSRPDPNTLLSLIRKWRSESPDRPSSPQWEALSANTKKTWGSALNKIEEKWGGVPLSIFNDSRMVEKIINWRDSRASTPRAADIGVDVLKALLRFGVERGLLKTNVAAGIRKIYKGGQREEIIWTEEDMKRFHAAALKYDRLPAWDVLRFAALSGLRREDLATLNNEQVGQFAIVKRAKKRSRGGRRFATMPRIPELNALLEELSTRRRQEGVNAILVTGEGLPWHPDTMSKAIAEVRDLAGIVHVDEESGKSRKKHLHDARGTFATKLMVQTDLTDVEIADIMGWSPEEVARIRKVYVDQKAIVVAIGERIARGVNSNCKPG